MGYGVTGDWAVAQELAQEAFVRLWRRWRSVRDTDAAQAYLHRTVARCGNSARSWPNGRRGPGRFA
jgi:DNA-directed RNA polymerase specialized sigma24 family protein